jgi:hypothetical protein
MSRKTRLAERAAKRFEILTMLEKRMDARDEFYRQLELLVLKTREVPERFKNDWHVWTGIEKRRPWRSQPFVVLRIRMAARIAARKA